jgi:hypothetical protein
MLAFLVLLAILLLIFGVVGGVAVSPLLFLLLIAVAVLALFGFFARA